MNKLFLLFLVIFINSCGGTGGGSGEKLREVQNLVNENPGVLEDAIFTEINSVRANFTNAQIRPNPAPEQKAPLKRHVNSGGKTLDQVARAHSEASDKRDFIRMSCQKEVTYKGKYWNYTNTWTSVCPHYNPADQTTAWQRVDIADIANQGVGEVIAGLPLEWVTDVTPQIIAKQIVDLWMGSPDHRDQILDKSSTGPYATSTGIGIFISEKYNLIIATQLFIRD